MLSALHGRLRHILYDKLPLFQRYQRIRRYVKRMPGFFVEAGANDGLAQSLTAYLQKRDGWTGLLIEPIPDLAEACRRNRPGAEVEQTALVSADYPDSTIAMTYANLMSVVAGAMKSPEADAGHIRLGGQVQGLTPYPLVVPARTLSQVLDRHKVVHIDLLVLDVEGYELSALQGLDFARWQPTFILCEARFRAEVDGFLLPRYEVVDEMGDYDVLYRYRRIG